MSLGWIGGAYILLRSVGLTLGAWVGCWWADMPPDQRWWMGLSIQPQAGVALGMALVAKSAYPDIGDDILTIIIGSTVVYEIFGPVLTRLAIRRAGEAND